MRRALSALAPVAPTVASFLGYAATAPLFGRFSRNPPEFWAGSALSAALGYSQLRKPGALPKLGGMAGLASPAVVWWYLNRYSPYAAPTDALAVGQPFPDFDLATSTGGRLNRDDLRGDRVLVMCYRGAWCPFCVAQLVELRRSYQQFLDRGVRIVAVSVDGIGQSEALRQRVGLEIDFCSDHDGRLMDSLGIADDEGLTAGLSTAGFGGSAEIGRAIYVPTSFLLDEDGIIRWIRRTDNYRLRASVEEVARAIDENLPAPA